MKRILPIALLFCACGDSGRETTDSLSGETAGITTVSSPGTTSGTSSSPDPTTSSSGSTGGMGTSSSGETTSSTGMVETTSEETSASTGEDLIPCNLVDEFAICIENLEEDLNLCRSACDILFPTFDDSCLNGGCTAGCVQDYLNAWKSCVGRTPCGENDATCSIECNEDLEACFLDDNCIPGENDCHPEYWGCWAFCPSVNVPAPPGFNP